MLTTGGGWQDQAGAIFGGIKLIETTPGLAQDPNVRWLPPQLFGPDHANRRTLLYYTGITRLAKSILQEIVRGIFLKGVGADVLRVQGLLMIGFAVLGIVGAVRVFRKELQ